MGYLGSIMFSKPHQYFYSVSTDLFISTAVNISKKYTIHSIICNLLHKISIKLHYNLTLNVYKLYPTFQIVIINFLYIIWCIFSCILYGVFSVRFTIHSCSIYTILYQKQYSTSVIISTYLIIKKNN